MKKIVFIIAILMSVFINNLFAQDYKHPQINKKGKVLDSQGVKLGYVNKEGLVKDAKGRKIGFIDSNGTLTDAKGRKMGKAEKNGNYYNEFGALEFEVKNTDSDFCEMTDKSGQKIGTVHNDYKNQACAMLCFFKPENMKEQKNSTQTAVTNLDTVAISTKQELSALLNLYYELKDALIVDNGELANQKAGEFVKSLSIVKMDKMTATQHSVWMKYADKLKTHAEYINQTKEVGKQREHLNELSNNLWEVMKAFKINDKTAYQQYCPMKKTYWISSEKSIKNPYYGNKMLTCGKVNATLE